MQEVLSLRGYGLYHHVFSREEMQELSETLAAASLDRTKAAQGSKAVDDKPRRVLHIEYAATSTFGPGLDLAVG
jgi:hypothetical protein